MMRLGRRSVLALLGSSFVAAPAWADEDVAVPEDILALEKQPDPKGPGNQAADWSQARDEGIARLIQLAKNEKAALRLGFAKAPVAADLTVLQPWQEAVVRLSELKGYQGPDPKPLVKRLDRLTFPILVQGKVRSSMTLTKLKGVWRATAFGAAPLMRALVRARIQAAKAVGPKQAPLLKAGRAARYTIVQVTGLNQYFVLAEGPADVYLIPISDGRFGARGAPQPLKAVIAKLVSDAQQHRGGVPT